MDPAPQKPQPVNPQWSETPPYLTCLGCLGILLGCSLLLCMGLCGGAYYTVFHTSVPLAAMEDLLESTEAIQIEGLSGSISRGFHIDKLRILTDDPNWSELTQIDFQFNGVRDLFENEQMLIEKFTVGGGTIYYRPPKDDQPEDSAARENENGPGPDPTAEEQPATDTPVDWSQGNSAPVSPFRALRIDLAEVRNLTLINSETGAQSQVNRVSFKNFQMLRDQVAQVGQFEVEGLALRDFTVPHPAGKDHGAAPSHVTGDFSLRRDPSDKALALAIAPGATFHLGQTPFDVQTREARLTADAKASTPIVAVHTSTDDAVTCRLYLLDESPYLALELQSGEEMSTPDLIARVLYGTTYDSLTDEERAIVDQTRQTAANIPSAEAQP